jgi:peroxiredoxin family protein
MEETRKLSIICFSGHFDKLLAAYTLATGAAAVGYEANMFFTFWGFNALKKNRGHAFLGRGFLSRVFNFLMGGRNNLPLSMLNFGGLSPHLMSILMKQRNVASLDQLMTAAAELGVNHYGCEMSLVIFGMKKEDLIAEVKDIIGVAGFLELSKGGQVLFL